MTPPPPAGAGPVPVTGLRRWAAVGGIAGPVAFIAAWSILGARRSGYSAISDPISRLAALDTQSRTQMTAGFVAFGTGVAMFVPALARVLPGGAAAAAATTAAATVGIAALPLGAAGGDSPHHYAAALAYAGLTAAPLLAARTYAAAGRRPATMASLATGVVVGTALVASALAPGANGFFQRLGLTVGDAWIIATAATLVCGKRPRGDAAGGAVLRPAGPSP